MNKYMEKRNEKGFTLIELLIAIVVVGILAAVAIVGIGGLTNTGGKSACTATADAAKAASAAYYASQQPNAWPTDFALMTSGANPVLELQSGVTVDTADASNKTLTNGSWKLVGIFPGAATAPTFDATASGNCTNP
jgi:type IV pilus assembly protein PilA